MADRFVVQAMGMLIEVDVSGLPEKDTLRARNVLSSRIVARPASYSVSADSPARPESSILSRIAREVSEVVRSEQPHLWWVAIEASLIGADGVILVCKAGDSIGVDHTSPQNQVGGEAVVGIDAEGGIDPLLCLSADLSWRETVASGGMGERIPSFARLRKIVFAERIAAEAETTTEPLPRQDALQALISASRGLAQLRDAADALDSMLERTGGAVRVRYTDPTALERSVRSLVTHLPATHPVRREKAMGGVESESVWHDDGSDPSTNHARLWVVGAGVVWTSSGDRTYALNTLDTQAVPILFEHSAHHIWQEVAAESGTSISRVVRRISAMYDVSGGEIADSIDRLLRDLNDRGLVDSTEIGSQ